MRRCFRMVCRLDMVESEWICYTFSCHIGTLSEVERSDNERKKTG